MEMKKNKKCEPRLTKVALNVCKEDKPGCFQIYQFYGSNPMLQIPLLGRRVNGEFVPVPSPTMEDAWRRLHSEYYEN